MSFGQAASLLEDFKRAETFALVQEDMDFMNEQEHGILFEGQIGGHLEIHAWQQSHLPGGAVDYVRVWFYLYSDYRHPSSDPTEQKPFQETDFFMTKESFLRVLGQSLASIAL